MRFLARDGFVLGGTVLHRDELVEHVEAWSFHLGPLFDDERLALCVPGALICIDARCVGDFETSSFEPFAHARHMAYVHLARARTSRNGHAGACAEQRDAARFQRQGAIVLEQHDAFARSEVRNASAVFLELGCFV